MTTQWGQWMGAGVLGLLAAATAGAQPDKKDARVEMSVDIAITHAVLDSDGNHVGPAPTPTRFTLTRARGEGGWRTTMMFRRHSGTPTRASAHPLDGARIEFDEASSTTQVFDADGQLNPLLSRTTSGGLNPAAGPGQWLEGLLATAAGRSARARALQDKHGKAVGRLRGLDRFLTQRENGTEEVLADPRAALPIEINTVRDGVLEQHIVFEYDRRPDGAWARRLMRSEQPVPGSAGHRARMTVEFTNLVVAGR